MLQKAKDALSSINDKIKKMQPDGYINDISEEIKILKEYVNKNHKINCPLFVYSITYYGTNPPKGVESYCHKDYRGNYFCFAIQDEDGNVYSDNASDVFGKCENPTYLGLEDDTVIATYSYVEELELLVAIPKVGSVSVGKEFPSGHEIRIEYGEMKFATKELKQFSLDYPTKVFNGLPICGECNELNWMQELKKMFPEQCLIVNRRRDKPVVLKNTYRANKYGFGKYDVEPADEKCQKLLNELLNTKRLKELNFIKSKDEYFLKRRDIVERASSNLYVYRVFYTYSDIQLEVYRMYMEIDKVVQCEIVNNGRYVYVEHSLLNTTKARKALKKAIAENTLQIGEYICVDEYVCH